jgi:hypothetical protein
VSRGLPDDRVDDLFRDEEEPRDALVAALEAELHAADDTIRDLEAKIVELEEKLKGAPAPAALSGGVNAALWKPIIKGSLIGISDLIYRPLVIKGTGLAVGPHGEFVKFPTREWIDQDGKKHFEDIIGFTGGADAARFKKAALQAVRRARDRTGQLPEQLVLPADQMAQMGDRGDRP